MLNAVQGCRLIVPVETALEMFQKCRDCRVALYILEAWVSQLRRSTKYLGPNLLLQYPVRIEPFDTFFKMCFGHLQEDKPSFEKPRNISMLLLGKRYLE